MLAIVSVMPVSEVAEKPSEMDNGNSGPSSILYHRLNNDGVFVDLFPVPDRPAITVTSESRNFHVVVCDHGVEVHSTDTEEILFRMDNNLKIG